MKQAQFKNSASQMTIQDAIELYKIGIATVITDGRDVTFMVEKEPIADQAK